jgi:hypothetical protein
MANENSPQNQTREPLRRPVRQFTQQEEERTERITETLGWIFVITAFSIDGFEVVLNAVGIGEVLSTIISLCADMGFVIWFWTKGVTFVKKPKNLAAMGIQAIIGLIPVLNTLPELTLGVLAIVLITRSEDKGGLLGKAAGAAQMAQGKIKS